MNLLYVCAGVHMTHVYTMMSMVYVCMYDNYKQRETELSHASVWRFCLCNILVVFWLQFGCFLAVLWFHFGCALLVPWLCYGCAMVEFW